MKKGFSETVGVIFGVIGFLLVLGGVGHMEVGSSPDSFIEGLLVALFGLGIFILVVIGSFLRNRSQPPLPEWEKKRRQRLGLFI